MVQGELHRHLTLTAMGELLKFATEKKTKGLNSDPPLSCIIEDYARADGVFGRNNNFCRKLIRIAETYHDPYKD